MKRLVVNQERAVAILRFAAIYGDAEACTTFSVTDATLQRYRRQYPDEKRDLAARLLGKHTADELRAMLKAGQALCYNTHVTNFDGEVYEFGLVGDTHVGSKFFDAGWWESAVTELARLKIRNLYHVGDVTEGMSNRPGHIYELTHLGYAEQRDEAIRKLEMFDGDIFMIDGNHDRWFQKSNGALVVEDICGRHPDRWHFLGQDEGRHVVNGVDIRLWHGEDSSSYAVSYRIQKICEAFTGGEKPHVLLLGHVHKATYLMERNIHCVSAGSIQRQTRWARGKRIAFHNGFWVVRLVLGTAEVKSITITWHPFYV